MEYLEGEVEGDGGVVPEDAAPVPPPKRQEPFVPHAPVYAIDHPLEPPPPAADDGEVALLGLEDELGALDRRDDGVDDAAADGGGKNVPLELTDAGLALLAADAASIAAAGGTGGVFAVVGHCRWCDGVVVVVASFPAISAELGEPVVEGVRGKGRTRTEMLLFGETSLRPRGRREAACLLHPRGAHPLKKIIFFFLTILRACI